MSPELFAEVKAALLELIESTGSSSMSARSVGAQRSDAVRREIEALLAHDPGDALPAADAQSVIAFLDIPSQDVTEELTSAPTLRPGRAIAGRYRIERPLGRGGMGEVWLATDVKLQLDVALKAIRPDLARRESLRKSLRREIRAARQVISVNVCRIHDIIETEGIELLSMEYVDGETLTHRLQRESPLPDPEARRIITGILSGLDAIHEAGLIHLDLKPENIMITRSGRIVIMDLGLARPLSAPDVLGGTPPYMSPEHVLGRDIDARADLFAAGMVLAEMVAPQGVRTPADREAVQSMARSRQLASARGRWRHALTNALAPRADDRFPSARAFLQAIQQTAEPGASVDTRSPYPGLDAFSESDRRYFFGREIDIEAIVTRLLRSHLVSVVGPSGAGKTSLIRAGLLTNLPSGWSAVYLRPGNKPVTALAQALAPAILGDADAVRDLARFNDTSVARNVLERWRRQHVECLIVVDQFEEIFTMADDESRSRFVELLGALVLDAGMHVLVGIRDDFLMSCHRHAELRPLFSQIVPVSGLAEGELRRALIEPALACGVAFEDDALPDEMIREVVGERGGLPLIAYAMAYMWEHRDRERHLLTRNVYRDMGGVAGALSRHAEETMERIGPERLPIVRELFRNLVTARGTRIGRDVADLVSLFDDRAGADDVIQTLIDARLLNSYQILPDEEVRDATSRRVEIIHESLLSAWPRLRRWRTQDEEGAQLRDQLRQAAQIWHERGRSGALLWTGTAYREFRLWRERHPEPLTDVEAAFGSAMETAEEHRQRRRRRAVASGFAVLTLVLLIVGGLWRQSVANTRRAEANRLLAEAQLRVDENPTASLAFTLASLESADSPEARRFAIATLWRGPTYRVPPASWWSEDRMDRVATFSPDGQWLVTGGERCRLYRRDGGEPIEIPRPTDVRAERIFYNFFQFSADSDRLAFNTFGAEGGKTYQDLHVWSMSEHRFIWHKRDVRLLRLVPDGDRIITWAAPNDSLRSVQAWSLDDQPPSTLLRLPAAEITLPAVDPTGRWMAYALEDDLIVRSLDSTAGPPRVVGTARAEIRPWSIAFDRDGRLVAAADESGEISVWQTGAERSAPVHRIPTRETAGQLRFSPSGRRLAAGNREGTVSIWSLDELSVVEPLRLTGFTQNVWDLNFDPTGGWLVKTGGGAVSLWAIDQPTCRVIRTHTHAVYDIAVAPHDAFFVTSSADGSIRKWVLGDSPADAIPGLVDTSLAASGLMRATRLLLDASGSRLVTNCPITVRDLESGTSREFPSVCIYNAVALSPDGRYLAVGNAWVVGQESRIRVWDLEGDGVRDLEWVGERFVVDLRFTPDGRLLAAQNRMLGQWDVESGAYEHLADGFYQRMDLAPGGRSLAVVEQAVLDDANPFGEVKLLDLETREWSTLTSHGDAVKEVVFGPRGDLIATSTASGVVQVGPVSGETPHLLMGHEGAVNALAFAARGRTLISGGADGTVRMWPIPEGRPLQTLSHEAFTAHLRMRTNLRLTRDLPDEARTRSPTVAISTPDGYHIAPDTFPGWARLK